MKHEQLKDFIFSTWDKTIVPNLVEYIKIPNKSPMFDHDWEKHGYMDQVVTLMTNWVKEQNVQGLKLDVLRLPNRTPFIFIEVPAHPDCTSNKTIMLYGHLDKQPEMTGWREDLSPWKPVIEGDKLYGRGGADDGYAIFSAVTAINALQQQNIPHSRCIIMIEAWEESGSPDLPFYLQHLGSRVGEVDLVICLDSGSANYDQMWSTTSLRGLVGGELKVEVLKQGVHSGSYSGVVPSSFRILREILDRVEDSKTGEIKLKEFYVEIPEQRIKQAKDAGKIMSDELIRTTPFLPGVKPVQSDPVQLLLDATWRPKLAITGADGLPPIESAGNVLRPFTAVRLSFRIPPGCDSQKAEKALEKALLENPPYNAKVTYVAEKCSEGWHAPLLADWLAKVSDEASQRYFGKPAGYRGEGASIPFMGMLGRRFPKAQFLITGVLGPESNAHGPNEFLHIPTAKKLTACVAEVIVAQMQA